MARDASRVPGCHAPGWSCRGYTLWDLLLTSAIAGVLTTASFSVGAVVYSARLTSTINTLLAILALARSEAIKRQEPVSICKTANGADCSAAASWADGWLVFVDVDRNGQRDGSEPVIHVQLDIPMPLTIDYRGFGPGVGRHVTYLPSGFTHEQNGSFVVCDHRGGTEARAVILYKTGRARAARRNAAGEPLRCG